MTLKSKTPQGTTPVLLPVKSDVIFRIFFADERNVDELVRFLKAIVDLGDDEYEKIVVADPHLIREFVDDKLAVIDVKLHTKSEKVIHIEIQLKVPDEFKNRIVFYAAKLITEQIGDGKRYAEINKVISIIITDEPLVENSERYHHRFTLTDIDTGVQLTDLIEIHTLELEKLPENDDGTGLYDWAKFIDAETEEELDMLAQRNPQFQQPVLKLRELSANEEARNLYERRKKAERDKAMLENSAENKGVKKQAVSSALEMIADNMPIPLITKYTGLTEQQIRELQ
jgi:predicted transposase/invertase (TIGR01784 family)